MQEFTELQKRQASTTKMFEASAALLQKAGDTVGRQGSRLEREWADRDEVQSSQPLGGPSCHTHVAAV